MNLKKIKDSEQIVFYVGDKVDDKKEIKDAVLTDSEKLKQLRDFVSEFPYYLAESQPYSKGYKDGCFRTREIILNTMDELGL